MELNSEKEIIEDSDILFHEDSEEAIWYRFMCLQNQLYLKLDMHDKFVFKEIVFFKL